MQGIYSSSTADVSSAICHSEIEPKSFACLPSPVYNIIFHYAQLCYQALPQNISQKHLHISLTVLLLVAVTASQMQCGCSVVSPSSCWWCMPLLSVSSSQSCPVRRKTGWRVSRFTVAVSGQQLARPCLGCRRTGLAPSSKVLLPQASTSYRTNASFLGKIYLIYVWILMSADSVAMKKTFKEERLMWIMRPAHGYSMILVDPLNWEYSAINSGDTSLLLYFFFQTRPWSFYLKGFESTVNCQLGGKNPLPLRESYYIVNCCEFSGTFLWSTLGWPRREADHGQKLCGSPFNFPNLLQAPKLTGKDTGNEAVGRERSSEEGWSGVGKTRAWVCL